MPTLEFETTLPASLQQVWALYDDPRVGLPAISSPAMDVRVESVDMPLSVGSHVVITATVPIRGRIKWVAKYVEFVPPHAVVFGEEARFVDEQVEGPFAYWRHEHEFEHVDERTTRQIDRVTYRVPYGPIGWVVEWLIVRPALRRMFSERHARTIHYLQAQFPAR